MVDVGTNILFGRNKKKIKIGETYTYVIAHLSFSYNNVYSMQLL